MNKAKVFAIMAEAGPIGHELVRVLESKGVGIPVWAISMVMSLLSIELDGKRVDDEFIIGIIRTVYAVQRSAEKAEIIDKAEAS